jgi:NAD(P)-dependent dehydrogenase (short-subunit alcohol dehydrogenase family)
MRAVVTGANRGLGFEVSRQLIERGYEVVVTARDEDEARAAAEQLGSRHSLALDVADRHSVTRAATTLANLGPVDALINNAGVSFDGFDRELATKTLAVNTWGTADVTDALRTLLGPNSNVVMVSSGMGALQRLGAPLRARLLSATLDRPALQDMGAEFLTAIEQGHLERSGFPRNAYGVSKALLNALTRIYAAQWRAEGPRVNAVCPGWVRTRMGGLGAPRSLEQGARGIVWAATLGSGAPRGAFFRDAEPIEW